MRPVPAQPVSSDPARAGLLARVAEDFTYHPPATEQAVSLHDEVTTRCRELANWLALYVPMGRDLSLALTHLEDVRMRANKAIALDPTNRKD